MRHPAYADLTLAASELDARDPLAARRALFALPEGITYLDGNSLGALPHAAARRASQVVQAEWGNSLIRAWNAHDWIGLPQRVGNRIGELIGAEADSVIVGDSTSVSIFKLLAVALQLRPMRPTILTDDSNFPTDLYVADGLTEMLGGSRRVAIVRPENLAAAIDAETAVVLVSDVDYRHGSRRDIAELTAAAHAKGALIIWDLCHSAGALPLDLAGARVDFAVGCSYKYLNGGPGAPAYLYVAPVHQPIIRQPISGWLGHAAPFRFELDYRPAEGITRMISGTPSVLGLSVLDAALDAFDGVDMALLRAKALALGDLFHARIAKALPELQCLTPLAPDQRGSQLSYACRDGYAIVQALIAEGVIGDFREPGIMRFGFAPLYNSFADSARAADLLIAIMHDERWRRPQFQRRLAVT